MAKRLQMDNGDVTDDSTDADGDAVVWPENGYPIEGEGGNIPCGCGNYSVMVPTQPKAIDVVCPVCGNHFGFDSDE